MSAKLTLYLGLGLVFVIYFLLSTPYYSGDVKNHLVWAESLLDHGPLGFYGREFHDYAFPNYPPVAMFLFAISLKFYYWINQLIWYLNVNFGVFPSNLVFFFQTENTKIAFLKIPAILSNLSLAVILYYLFKLFQKDQYKQLLVSILFIINPAAIYLSVVWGQIDMLPIMFFLLAVLMLFQKRWIIASFVFIMALLSKQTVIIFLPVFLWVFLREYGLKKLATGLIIMLAFFYFSYIPFNNNSLMWPFELYKLNFYLVAPSVGENVINLWGMLFNFQRVYDGNNFWLITYQQWGYLIFILIISLPTIFLVRKKNLNLKNTLTYLFLLSAIYFFTLTRMHERYLIPSIPFLTLLVMTSKKYIVVLTFFTLLNFLNLYRGLLQPDIPQLVYLVQNNVFLNLLVVSYIGLLIYYLKFFIRNES